MAFAAAGLPKFFQAKLPLSFLDQTKTACKSLINRTFKCLRQTKVLSMGLFREIDDDYLPIRGAAAVDRQLFNAFRDAILQQQREDRKRPSVGKQARQLNFGLLMDQTRIRFWQKEAQKILPRRAAKLAIGTRSYMQDALLCSNFIWRGHNVKVSAIFDGHGVDGEHAAAFVCKNLIPFLKKHLEGVEDRVAFYQAIRACFEDLDACYQGEGGTTANVALFFDNQLWIANVGDSRAILLDEKGFVLQLSEDASLKELKYRYEITNSGCELMEDAGAVLRVNGKLALARSIGDHQFKPCVLARPEITCYERSEGQLAKCRLLQCSDGFTFVASSSVLGKKLRQFLRKNPSLKAAASQLLKAACKSWPHSDNMAIIVQKLEH